MRSPKPESPFEGTTALRELAGAAHSQCDNGGLVMTPFAPESTRDYCRDSELSGPRPALQPQMGHLGCPGLHLTLSDTSVTVLLPLTLAYA